MTEIFFLILGRPGRDLGYDRSPGHDTIFIYGS
jgi:hypothetical protein